MNSPGAIRSEGWPSRIAYLPTPFLTVVILAIYGWSTVFVKHASLSVLKQVRQTSTPSGNQSNFTLKRERIKNCDRLRDRTLRTVWTLPNQPPPNIQHNCSDVEEIMICAYSPCLQAYANASGIHVDGVNLRLLSAGTAYEDFVNDHMFYKVNYGTDYVYHVQFVTMLLLANATNGNVCVRSLGDGLDDLICKEDIDLLHDTYLPRRSSNPPQFFMERNSSILFTEFTDTFTVLDYEDHRKRSNVNTGDDLQVLPGVQFMPYVNKFISRANGVPDATGHVIMNAWWGSKTEFPPNLEKVHATLFSMHMSRKMATITLPTVKDWFVNYSRQIGPVGARDLNTLELLRKTGITSYMSSCFTLTLDLGQRNKIHPHDKIIVADPALNVRKLPRQLENDTRVAWVTPNLPKRMNTDRKARFLYVESLLKVHATRAKVIVTSRIHVALPAAAQGVPVIFVNPANERTLPGGAGGRTSGISNIFHEYWADTDQEWDFDLDNMPPNPGVHQIDRYRASFWHYLRKRGPQVYKDSAAFYGIIPMQRLGAWVNFDPESVHDQFHFVFTEPSSSITWRDIRSIEYVFYHHPNARIYIHSNSVPARGTEFDIFRETGYDVVVQPYDVEELLATVALDDHGVIVRDPTHRLHSILVRCLVLHHYGGVSLDFGMYMVKTMPKSIHNYFSTRNVTGSVLEGHETILSFEKGFSTIKLLLRNILDALPNDMKSSIGTRMSGMIEDTAENWLHQHLNQDVLLSVSHDSAVQCFTDTKLNSETPHEHHFVVRLDPDQTRQVHFTKKDSWCDDLLNKYCIFCDEIQTSD